MIRLNVFFELNDGVTPELFAGAAASLIEQSRADEGCVSYDLFQSTTRERVMLFCETWKDRAALDQHGSSAYFAEAMEVLKPLMKGEWKLEKFPFGK